VKSRGSIWLLTVFAMLCAAVAPPALATWQCEGRICGVTPWQCCCFSTGEGRDNGCPAEIGDQTPAGACPSDRCRCTMTLTATEVGKPPAAAKMALRILLPALLPAASPLPEPLPAEKIARTLETRGPPRAPVAFRSLLLRAPPAA
jgi:hypothetical protein